MPFTVRKLVFSVALACFAAGANQAAFAKAERKAPAAVASGAKAKAGKKVKAPAAKPAKKTVAASGKKAAKTAEKAKKVRRGGASAGVVRTNLNRARTAEKREVQIPEDQIVAQQLRQQSATNSLVLNSACALMYNQDSGRVLFEKNADSQLPVASLTKLMSALVIMRSGLSMDEAFTVQREDYNLRSSSFSRLRIGMTLTRADLLHVALTGSDNRAIHTLARTYPGGMEAFVRKMNETARELGLRNTSFEEPTGLSPNNRSTAREITRIAAEAYRYPKIREYSTTPNIEVPTQAGLIQVRSTNRLIREGNWDIGLQKTGYTGAAGHCMVLQSEIGGNRVLMVVLNSTSNNGRVADMKKMRDWYEKQLGVKTGAAKLPYNLM